MMFQQLPTAGLPFQFEHLVRLRGLCPGPARHRRDRGDRRDPLGRPTGAQARDRRGPDLRRRLDPAPRCARWWRSPTAWWSTSPTASNGARSCPTMPPWHVQENKWRAARYGLDAWIILDEHSNEWLMQDDLARAARAAGPGRRAARLQPTTSPWSRRSRAVARRTSASGRSPSAPTATWWPWSTRWCGSSEPRRRSAQARGVRRQGRDLVGGGQRVHARDREQVGDQ